MDRRIAAANLLVLPELDLLHVKFLMGVVVEILELFVHSYLQAPRGLGRTWNWNSFDRTITRMVREGSKLPRPSGHHRRIRDRSGKGWFWRIGDGR
jgi:hypothetical protein